MSDQEPRRTVLESGIKTEYDHESGLVHIVVISSAEYADVGLEVAKHQLKNVLARIGQPQSPGPRPKPQATPIHPQEPTLPRVSQHHYREPDPYDYPEPRF